MYEKKKNQVKTRQITYFNLKYRSVNEKQAEGGKNIFPASNVKITRDTDDSFTQNIKKEKKNHIIQNSVL